MNAEQIKAAAKEGTEEALKGLKVSNEQHFEDHRFIKRTRDGITKVRMGSLVTLGASFIGAVVWAIKSWIASFSTGGTP